MADSDFAIPEEINPTTFERYQTLLYRALVNVSAKRNNELPSKEVPFYRMIDPTAARKMDRLSGRTLPRINQMISAIDLPGSESFCEISEAEDVDSWSKDFVSLIDSLIDGVVSIGSHLLTFLDLITYLHLALLFRMCHWMNSVVELKKSRLQ